MPYLETLISLALAAVQIARLATSLFPQNGLLCRTLPRLCR